MRVGDEMDVEKQVAVMSRDIIQLKSTVKENTGAIRMVEKSVADLNIGWLKTLNEVNTRLTETVTKLKTQTRFTILTVTTLFPAQLALLWKIFFG